MGKPMPTVTWLEITTGNHTFGDPHVLTNISRTSAGEYVCEATNVCGNDSQALTLTVNCEYWFSKNSKIISIVKHLQSLNGASFIPRETRHKQQ